MARRLLPLLTVLLLGGCDAYYDGWSPDDLVKAIPWFDHMITSRAVHPYARSDIPRTTVPGTVPITGSEGDWGSSDRFQLQYAFDSSAAKRMMNPTNPEETLVRGDTLYHTFCAVCHGGAGAGDGAVGLRMGGAPSLLTDKARAYADGYLYGMIRYGRGLMPQYGDKVYRPLDRWAIVNYVRKLQREAAAAAPPGAK